MEPRPYARQGAECTAVADTSRHREWLAAGGCVMAGLVAIVALYSEAFAGMLSAWSNTTPFRFLFLVAPASAAFLWLRLPTVRSMAPRPMLLGLLYAAPFGLLWLLGEAADAAVASQAAAVGMLQAVFLTVLGWHICARLLFPLLLLWLMVPAWDLLMPQMIALTTKLTLAGLHLSGVPATADGNLIVAGGKRYAIIEGCSGLDFVLGNLLVSLVFANLIYRSAARKTAYVLASLPVAVLANVLRTTSVVLLTALGIDLATDHKLYGWFLFLMAMAAQMAMGLRWRETPAEQAAVAARQCRRAGVPLPVAVAGIVLVAAIAPTYARFTLDARETGAVPVRLCVPPTLHDTLEPGKTAVAWRPAFPQAGARLHRVSREGGQAVDVFVAYYWQQAPGSELIGWGNRFFDAETWRHLASRPDREVFAAAPLEVVKERLEGPPPHRRVVWYWYWADGTFNADALWVKMLQARALLFGGDTRSAAIAFSTEESGDGVAAQEALRAALSRHPDLADMLNGAARAHSPDRACP